MELELAELSRETRSSIEVSRNAKGDYVWKLKRYYEDGAETEALETLGAIDDELRARFLPEPGGLMATVALFPELVTEREFTATVIETAHWRGWLVAHFRPARRADGSWMTPLQADGAGFPDLVLVRGPWLDQPARCLFCELKTQKGKLAPLQERWLAALRATGAEVYEWRPSDWDEIHAVLA